MNFDLTDEQRLIQTTVREFAQGEVAPRAEEMDRTHQFPYDLVAKMADLGLMGLPFPEQYGGAGGDTVSYALAVEEISRADASTGITLAAHVSLGSAPFYLFGSEEQKQEYLVPLARGERLWGFGLTEPEAGSDAGATRTRADSRDGQWVVNGSKCFITNSGTRITGGVTVAAVTGKRPDGKNEISSIIIPSGTPGFQVDPPYNKMGWRASDTHGLTFTECAVPQGNLLGARGGGYKQFLEILDGGRISVAALSVGVAQACLDASLRYANQRRQFGQPIGKFQAIQFKLADMATEIEMARLMTYKAAWLKDQKRDFSLTAGMAKLYASEASKRAADQAVQIHGGYGFMDEYAVSRYYRDCKINEIGEGTSEIQRLVIARLLGL
ncbi:MAG TPA: acyl-CoA dehydrogenase family protein [Chloroflexota bacterium]|nr:acyl-CoA dehydrogenase family protein [Chloroflexota bacterium]